MQKKIPTENENEMNTPTLSIIIPVFNTEKYIGETIRSILRQSYTDFELIIVDDGCTDRSVEIIISFRDSRIKIISNDTNKGIVYSRNRGLAEAKGRYIAPFDSDDIASPEKFEKQLFFLEKHPDFGMIGSWGRAIDDKGKLLKLKWKLPASPGQIPAILLFRSYFLQPTVVMRREAIPAEGYAEGFEIGEDYMMWFEIAKKFKVYNYPDYLYFYRIHPQSITQSKLELYKDCEFRIYLYIFKSLEIEVDKTIFNLLLLIKNNSAIQEFEKLSDIEEFLKLILTQNLVLKRYDQNELTAVIFNRWLKVCYKSRAFIFKASFRLLFSLLTRKYAMSLLKFTH